MKYAINAAEAPEAVGPYSQGTTAGRLVFASGQIAIDPDHPHHLIKGGVREQTERIIQIVEALLGEVDCNLSDVAQTTVYLKSLDDLEAFNEVYAVHFIAPAPARSVVEVAKLPLGALVEMDCIACR